MFLSNYGYTLSPFNQYPNKLNSLIFNIAGVIQVPTFLSAYIGALVVALKGTDSSFTTATIQNFFTIGAGKKLDSSGVFIFADLHDIDKYLSQQDKNNYESEFNTFMTTNYNDILAGVFEMYNTVKQDITFKGITDKAIIITEKQKQYKFYLNVNSKEDGAGTKYYQILSPLITRTNILNYIEIIRGIKNKNAVRSSVLGKFFMCLNFILFI